MPIYILDDNCFSGAVGKTTEGESCHSFIAKITPPGEEQFNAYVKIYPPLAASSPAAPKSRNRSLENEAIGYTVAKLCGMKVPTKSGFIALQREQVPDRPDWITGQSICWFSNDVKCPSVAHWTGIYEKQSSVETRRLQKYLNNNLDRIAAVAAFDESLYNTDRNPGNLLIDDTLIDHGHALTGATWSLEKLAALKAAGNHHNRLIQYLQDTAEHLNFKSARRKSSTNQSSNYQTSVQKMRILVYEILYSDDLITADAVLDFLAYRLENGNSANALRLTV